MRKTILLLLALLLLAGCGKETAQTKPTEINPQESNQTFRQQISPNDRIQGLFCYNLIEIPEGYYFFVHYYRSIRNRLAFCARGETTFHILCGKPNCSHADENCNACVSSQIMYFNGALYWLEQDEQDWDECKVLKMNLDGTDHQVVAEFTSQSGASRS